MSYRLPSRYLPSRRFRSRYPYGGSRRGGGAEAAAGIALATVLAAGLGAKTVVTVTHHHAGAPAVTAPVTSGSETAFISAVLADLGAPATQADITSLASWFPHEFPSWPPYAANNPMASTMQMPGSTTYNSVGVQNYPNPSEGAQAIALTLADGYYPQIVSSLRSGAGLCGNPSLAGEFLTWSGNGYSGVC